MSQRRFQLRLQLETFEDRLCPTVTLPISSFLSQQGTSALLTAPLPDQIAWANSTFDPGATSTDPNRLNMVDYTGTAARYLLQHGINLHTRITGFVTETPLGSTGLMEVSVNLEVTNALTWVAEVPTADLSTPAINTDPLELGYRAEDLVANPALPPALSSAHFQITFQEQAGAPLPDLFQALIVGNAPPGFAPEKINFQSWGTGTLRAATTAGTPGQTAIVSTWQVADLTNPNLPGTLADGFWQEPIDLIPLASPSSHFGYLNGTLFVMDLSNSNDSVVLPTPHGGAAVVSNLGVNVFPDVSRVVAALGSGNNNVVIGNFPGVTVDVVALDGNNNILVGGAGKLVVSVGGGNNNIVTGDSSPGATFVGVAGNGNNDVHVASANSAVLLVAGNGNNDIQARGTGDFIEVLGNGNNHIKDTGTNDTIWLGGDGNNTIDNRGDGSFTEILAARGHNHILGPWGFFGA